MKQCDKCKSWRKDFGLIHKCGHCRKWLCWDCYNNDEHTKDWVKHYGIEQSEDVVPEPRISW